MILAITGSAGAGKTTAAEVFQERGWHAVNADRLGHDLYRDGEVKALISASLGPEVFDEQGAIDRTKLKQAVFAEEAKLTKLNAIMHPRIIARIEREVSRLTNVVVDGALIVEVGWQGYDKLLLIVAEEKDVKKRLKKRKKYTDEEIKTILASQLPQEEKIEHADIVIENTGTEKQFKENVLRVIEAL